MSFCQDETYFYVETEQGKLRGKESVSDFDGKKYCSFLGIPYAKPPMGVSRFQVRLIYNNYLVTDYKAIF